MRKLISPCLFVLFLFAMSSQLLADGVEACDEDGMKATLQALDAYGLCIAWHNANENVKDKIAAKFEDRASFPVPGSEPEVVPDSEPEADCPCWDADDLYDAACNHVLTGPGVAFDDGYIQFFNFPEQCVYANYLTGEVTARPIGSEEHAICQAGIDALVNESLLDLCE